MDSDSDDSLLGAPAFTKKRTRKETAKDTKSTNLLDQMFTQQEERIRRQRRMDDSIKHEQEGFIPNEEDRMLSLGEAEDNPGLSVKMEGDTATNANLDSDDNESISSHVPTSRYNFDDPSYKARLEAIKEKSRKAALQPHDSRRRLLQQIDGIADDDEFGLDGDSDLLTEEAKDRRMAEIEGKHSTLGMRRTMGWNLDAKKEEGNRHDNQSFAPYESTDEAVIALDGLFKKYDVPPKRQHSDEHKDQWNSVRNQIIKPLIQAQNMDLLSHMLARHWKPSLDVPHDLVVWLVRVSTTGNLIMSVDLANGACDCLLNFMEGGMKVIHFDNVPERIFQISDFVPMLHSNYGLWNANKDPMVISSNNSGDGESNGTFEEPSGLRHAIMIWNAAIVNNFVAYPDLNETKIAVTQSIAAILFCGADPIFHSGHALLDIRSKLIGLLIKVSYTLIVQEGATPIPDEENESLQMWIGSCVDFVMESCKHYSKLPKVADEEAADDTGWLLIEIIIRSWNSVEEKHKCVLMFYSALCNAALGSCFKSNCLWDEELQRVSVKMSQRITKVDTNFPIQLRHKTIAAAEIALELLAKPGSTLLQDNPLLLATIRISSICEQVGIELFNNNIQNREAPSVNRGFCESDAEAGMLYEHLDRMCMSLQYLKAAIKVVVNKPFVMRSKELVLLLLSITASQRDTVRRWEKGRKSDVNVRRQSDLSCFLKPKQKEAVFESEDDSDDEM